MPSCVVSGSDGRQGRVLMTEAQTKPLCVAATDPRTWADAAAIRNEGTLYYLSAAVSAVRKLRCCVLACWEPTFMPNLELAE